MEIKEGQRWRVTKRLWETHPELQSDKLYGLVVGRIGKVVEIGNIDEPTDPPIGLEFTPDDPIILYFYPHEIERVTRPARRGGRME